MTGQKAIYLESWAAARGRAFVRFDYRGHGTSLAAFEDCTISDWAADARAVLEHLCEGPQILVGSSMGGWIALLLAREIPAHVAGVLGIAAAPDFTEDGVWEKLSGALREEITTKGRLEVSSAYSDAPYVITHRLIEDGRRNLVLRAPLQVPFPVRLLHGTADRDVEMSVALKLLEHIDAADVRLTLVKGAGHRLSEPEELALIGKTLHGLGHTIVSNGAR